MKKPRVNTADKQKGPREAPNARDPSSSQNGTTILRNETLFQMIDTGNLNKDELNALMEEVFDNVLPKMKSGNTSVSGPFGIFYLKNKH